MRNRKIRYLVLSAALMCVLTACSKNGIKEGTELLEKGDFEKAATVFEQAAKEAETEGERAPEAYRGMGMACYARWYRFRLHFWEGSARRPGRAC